MIFKSLTLHNLFSYYGTCTFDLMPRNGHVGNVIVIMGRNGFGKTSLLNSVKLLFGGVTKELRQSVQRGNSLSEKAFVLGAKEWWGILNHQAKNRQEMNCYVQAILLNENNQEIVVKRSWNLQNDDHENQLEVIAPRKSPLTKDAAQQLLSGLLPLDYIPFFFFDAEDIGYLAEANNNQVIEKMEQLLNIRPADNLRDCLKDLIKKIENKSITQDANLKLAKAENKYEELLIQKQGFHSQRQSIEFDIETLESDLRNIRQKINLFSGQGTLENNAKLEATKNGEQKNLEEALTGLSEAFAGDAFLSINAKLVQDTLPAIDRCAHGLKGATSEMLESLREPLKEVFTTPPYPNNQRLSDTQIVFYQRRVAKLLDSRDIEEEDTNLFRLDNWRAKKLLAVLSPFTSLHAPDASIREVLSRALRAERTISDIDKSLQEISQLSEDNRLQLEQLRDKYNYLENELDRLRKSEPDINHKLSSVDRELTELNNEIAECRKLARQSAQGRQRIELVEKMLKLLATYKLQLKQRQRGVLENYFNQHLASLLDSNRLIASVQIDEFFQLQYLDAGSSPIPMSSISAGMKQLAATALLWALKDACGRKLPVIIDTPLGRIDKQHQDNLLNKYYPHAAQQVILLPTDSELDERKRQSLAPYIYREYHLHNEDGDNTRAELVSLDKEAHYG